MPDKKDTDKRSKIGKRVRKVETVRERSEKAQSNENKPRRLRKTTSTLTRPVNAAKHIGKKEYYFPLPDNRLGRFLNKRRSLMPRFFSEAWTELKQVTWPSRRETWQLTVAVFVFALAFGLIVAATDYGLEKVFREVIL